MGPAGRQTGAVRGPAGGTIYILGGDKGHVISDLHACTICRFRLVTIVDIPKLGECRHYGASVSNINTVSESHTLLSVL